MTIFGNSFDSIISESPLFSAYENDLKVFLKVQRYSSLKFPTHESLTRKWLARADLVADLIRRQADVEQFCRDAVIAAPDISVTQAWKMILSKFEFSMLNLQSQDALLYESVIAVNDVCSLDFPSTFTEAKKFVKCFGKYLKKKGIDEGLNSCNFLALRVDSTPVLHLIQDLIDQIKPKSNFLPYCYFLPRTSEICQF